MLGDIDEIVLVLEVGYQLVLTDAENLILGVQGAVVLDEIQSQPDVIDTDQFGDVDDVIHELVERRLRCDHGRNRIDAENPTRFGQCLDLLVIDRAKVVVQFFAVGVTAANRPRGNSQDIESAGPRNMRKIDDHAEPFHFAHDGSAELRKPSAGSFFLHAIGEFVSQIPGDLHCSETQAVEIPEIFNAALERPTALEAEHEMDGFRRGSGGHIFAVQDQFHLTLGRRDLLAQAVDVLERRI